MYTSIQGLKMKKFIFWISAYTPIEKQSNQDWNTTIHLKKKYSTYGSSFDLLVSYNDFQLMFITNFGLNVYVYMLEIVLNILEKLIHDSRNVCGYLTLNEIHIELASLIIFSIKDSITNISSVGDVLMRLSLIKQIIMDDLHDVKKTVLCIGHIIVLCTSTETSIYWKFKDKIIILF